MKSRKKNQVKDSKINLSDKLFLVILCIFSFTFLIKVFLNSNNNNFVDNRVSYKLKIPTLKTLLSGDYQNEFEQAVADQMPKYNIFKLAYIKFSNYINVGTINLFDLYKYNQYINLGNINVYDKYLLYNYLSMDDFKGIVNKDIDEMNNIIDNTDVNFYFYFIENDSLYNFSTDKKIKAFKYIKNNLNIDSSHISLLELTSFDDYIKYFYKTDHHWNYEGSYSGYNDIADMMNFSNILEPTEKKCFEKITFYGSKVKNIGNIMLFQDKPCVYDFDYPNFTIYADGEEITSYGNSTEDLSSMNELSYASIYGTDYEEIIFINNDAVSDKKLLIYSNSFSNSINKLLASNYKETYVIDGRYYKDSNMIDYIKEKEIDDVLVIGNNMLFADKINW